MGEDDPEEEHTTSSPPLSNESLERPLFNLAILSINITRIESSRRESDSGPFSNPVARQDVYNLGLELVASNNHPDLILYLDSLGRENWE